MSEEIFRKKSLDKVKSPENLDDYIQVSNPGVWLLLVSVIVLLIGACVWGILGHIDSTVPATVRIENGAALCYVSDADIASVKEGMTVKFGEVEATIASIGDRSEMGYECLLTTGSSLTDGFYQGKLVTETHKPLSFILN